ncbi:MAG: energy transducer TonB, partial [Gemmatimonadaceae bacterium]|nr:energy transducer TonB [Acetobacteraceae bacterium]
AATARAPSPPAVNLGDAEAARDALEVTGRGVVPATPNSRFRNQPPGYPMAAARIGAEGTVGLLVQVSAQGVATDVAVARSSGNDSLDRAARDAVRRWRFTPARIQGTPVPFEYPLDINFILGDR